MEAYRLYTVVPQLFAFIDRQGQRLFSVNMFTRDEALLRDLVMRLGVGQVEHALELRIFEHLFQVFALLQT